LVNYHLILLGVSVVGMRDAPRKRRWLRGLTTRGCVCMERQRRSSHRAGH
jgi:hypothetical protein